MLSVEIQAEAVQAANVTPDFTAEAPWGEELEIEQCVHEADNTVSEVSQQSFLTVSYEGAARNLILAPDNFFRNFPVLMPGDVMGRYVHTGEHDSKPCRIFSADGTSGRTQ